MINIKKHSLIGFIIYLGGCMEPNEENIWSVQVDGVLNTEGFCRSLSISNDTAYVAAGQSGVQIWDLNNEVKLQNHFGYIQDFANIEFDDIVLVKRDEVNNLIFVTESNKKVKIFESTVDSQFVYRNEIMSDRTKDYISFSSSNNRFTMFVADNDDGLKWGKYRPDTTVDIFTDLVSINWLPVVGGEILSEGKPLGIDSDGQSKIVMAVDQLGVEFFSFDTISNEPAFTKKIDLQGNAEQVKLTQSGVFVSCDDAGAYFVSNSYIESDEGSLTRFATDLTVDHISIYNNIAILSIGSSGIALYDISDPENPISRGIFDVGYVYKSYGWKDKFHLCTRSGVKIISINQ